jgi:pimeloyl-ACP methyl ester carboxylesterase
MSLLYCTWALFLLFAAPVAAQQGAGAAEAPAGEATAAIRSYSYTVFLRGAPVGRENVTVRTDPSGVTISSQGQLPMLNVVTRRAEVRYRSDWMPESLVLESTVNGADILLRTTFKDGSALTEGTEAGKPVTKTDPVSPQTLVLPNLFFGAYEAVGHRLSAESAGEELRAYVAPQGEVAFRVRSVGTDRMQTGTSTFNVRRYDLIFTNSDGELAASLSVDENGALLRLAVPSTALDVVRDDLASPTARTRVYSNPGDEAVVVPGAGFNLGATLTRPKPQPPSPGSGRMPAVVLLADARVDDRDGYSAGVPVLGQLAGALADAGFVVVRYDRRGSGQSGGRPESATLQDFAEDARAVVRWLASRRDLDSRRIALVGHGQGAWVGLLAASREKRIAAVVSIAAAASTGVQFTLEQQRQTLARTNAPESERVSKIELQEKIHAAVMTGRGWEGVPTELRRRADTPLFQSILSFDPARVVDDVRQPLLFLHGELDREVPVMHLDQIANLARKESKSKSIEAVAVRGVNHLLVPASTGEVSEYVSLQNRTISKDATASIASWLLRTFAPTR